MYSIQNLVKHLRWSLSRRLPFQLLHIFAKLCILDVPQGFEHASEIPQSLLLLIKAIELCMYLKRTNFRESVKIDTDKNRHNS